MIDIGVTGLVKSFDLEKKILDGLTLQIDTAGTYGDLRSDRPQRGGEDHPF